MKKRRPAQPNHPADDLDRFDDAAAASMTMDALPRDGGGNTKGGMSRAARKRAKKRARSAATTTAPSTTNETNSNSGVGEKLPLENGDGNNGKKKKKMQLPLDDEDDGDDMNHDGKSGGQDLMGSIQQFRKASSQPKKKKNKSKKNDKGGETLAVEDAAAPEAAAAAAGAAGAAVEGSHTVEPSAEPMDAMDMDDVDVDDADMEPELEALLATLTPRQILMLDDDHDEGSDSKQPSSPLEGNGEEDAIANDSNDDGDEDAPPSEMDTPEEGALAGVDPRQIIGDVTTPHRARILLLSLLSPSGVTLHEFYQRYWGKRPLLAQYPDEGEDDDEGNGANTKPTTSGGEAQDDEAMEMAREHASRLDGFLNRPLIHDMIQRNKLRYGLDLNVTNYTDAMGNGVRHRITLDPPPKKRKTSKGKANKDADDELEYVVANPNDVWSNVDASHCSLRLLRPHEHNDAVHAMLSLLESEFGCMVGSNAYLTPLNSQGFAPHYDDVDVFILQLEGYKRWRVHAPFKKRETLPRESSRDYTEKEVEEMGEELMDVVLGPGDVLYLPRGWIHQAETVRRPSHLPKLPGIKDDHSLHLTVSAMQNWCWADFLEMLMPEALETAAGSDKSISLREGLPKNFLSYMGTMHQVEEDDGADGPEGLKQAAAAAQAQSLTNGEGHEMDEEALMEARAKQQLIARQKQFKDEAKKRIMRVCKQAMSMLDDACDQIGKRFLSDRLPPAFLAPERCLTKEGLSDGTNALHHHEAAKKIWPNTLCRLVRPGIARLVVEDDKAVLYHCLDNSRVFHGTPLSPMEFEIDDAPALEQLLTTVEPRWIMVKDLIHGDVEDKMGIAQALFDEGVLATALTEAPDRSVQTG